MGYFVDPYWLGLSAFVGAGLMFAGITDTCGMAMLLARMPWNQVKDEPKANTCRRLCPLKRRISFEMTGRRTSRRSAPKRAGG